MEMDSVEEMLGKSVENKEISPKGRKCSEETKAKISAAKRGRKLSDEHRAKISAAGRGRKLSEETKAKISAAWTPGWGGRDGIHADHLDGDKTNNTPENLVVSCGPCNCLRAYDGNPRNWSFDV